MSQQCVSEHSCPAPSPHRARSHPCTRAREREPSPAPFLGPGRYEPGEGATQQSGGCRHRWAPLRIPREEKPPGPQGPRMGAWSLALPFPPLKKVIFPVLPLGEVAGILPSSRNSLKPLMPPAAPGGPAHLRRPSSRPAPASPVALRAPPGCNDRAALRTSVRGSIAGQFSVPSPFTSNLMVLFPFLSGIFFPLLFLFNFS